MTFDNVYIDGSGTIANENIRDDIRDAIRSRKGKYLDITIQLHREGPRKRSLDQNAYLHAEPFPKLAKAWGESIARTKLICMGQFWGWEPCKVTGLLLPVKAHTSEMTVEECTLFIDWLIPWAADDPHYVEILPPMTWLERMAA